MTQVYKQGEVVLGPSKGGMREVSIVNLGKPQLVLVKFSGWDELTPLAIDDNWLECSTEAKDDAIKDLAKLGVRLTVAEIDEAFQKGQPTQPSAQRLTVVIEAQGITADNAIERIRAKLEDYPFRIVSIAQDSPILP